MHLMLDFETLAASSEAAILTMGAVKFDPNGDETMEEFYYRIDLDSCVDIGLEINEDTINWWAKQSKEAQDEAFSDDGRITIAEAFDNLTDFCHNVTKVWSNGATFDIVICETVYNRLNKKIPWKFWDIRDCRTMYDLGIDPKLPKITAHNALADAKAQAIGVQNVSRILRYASLKPFTKRK